jgi:hypothetical protein
MGKFIEFVAYFAIVLIAAALASICALLTIWFGWYPIVGAVLNGLVAIFFCYKCLSV